MRCAREHQEQKQREKVPLHGLALEIKETICPGATAKYSGNDAGMNELEVVAVCGDDPITNEAEAPQMIRMMAVELLKAADEAAVPPSATGV
jgi:hypothetical protein